MIYRSENIGWRIIYRTFMIWAKQSRDIKRESNKKRKFDHLFWWSTSNNKMPKERRNNEEFLKTKFMLESNSPNFFLPFIFLITFNLIFHEIFYSRVLNVPLCVPFTFLRFFWKIKNQIALHHIFKKLLNMTSFHPRMKMYRFTPRWKMHLNKKYFTLGWNNACKLPLSVRVHTYRVLKI